MVSREVVSAVMEGSDPETGESVIYSSEELDDTDADATFLIDKERKGRGKRRSGARRNSSSSLHESSPSPARKRSRVPVASSGATTSVRRATKKRAEPGPGFPS